MHKVNRLEAPQQNIEKWYLYIGISGLVGFLLGMVVYGIVQHVSIKHRESVKAGSIAYQHKEPKMAMKPLSLVMKGHHKSVIEEVEARYRMNKTYEDAIFLATTYYTKNDYPKALYWALKANSMNAVKEESWILFAKTKFILGKEHDAIKALKGYLSKYHSYTITQLLQEMEENLME
jgi:hypothetical protein